MSTRTTGPVRSPARRSHIDWSSLAIELRCPKCGEELELRRLATLQAKCELCGKEDELQAMEEHFEAVHQHPSDTAAPSTSGIASPVSRARETTASPAAVSPDVSRRATSGSRLRDAASDSERPPPASPFSLFVAERLNIPFIDVPTESQFSVSAASLLNNAFLDFPPESLLPRNHPDFSRRGTSSSAALSSTAGPATTATAPIPSAVGEPPRTSQRPQQPSPPKRSPPPVVAVPSPDAAIGSHVQSRQFSDRIEASVDYWSPEKQMERRRYAPDGLPMLDTSVGPSGKHYCGRRLATVHGYRRGNDCDCQRENNAAGVCRPFTNLYGERVGCNCRSCMELDIEHCVYPNTHQKFGTLLNMNGYISEVHQKRSKIWNTITHSFHCRRQFIDKNLKERVCAKSEGTCSACKHLKRNWLTRGYAEALRGHVHSTTSTRT